jgi:hypothetical protein
MLRAVALSFAIVGHRTERLGARQKLEMLRAVALSSAIVGHRTERLRALQKLKMLRAVALSFAIYDTEQRDWGHLLGHFGSFSLQN